MFLQSYLFRATLGAAPMSATAADSGGFDIIAFLWSSLLMVIALIIWVFALITAWSCTKGQLFNRILSMVFAFFLPEIYLAQHFIRGYYFGEDVCQGESKYDWSRVKAFQNRFGRPAGLPAAADPYR